MLKLFNIFYIEITQMKVNSWTHWQPLKQIVLGNCFEPEFFEDVKDTKLRDSLQRIIHETKEDLNGIKKTLEDLGVEVIQVDSKWADSCQINPYKSFGEFIELSKQKSITNILRPMIAPRDIYITLGDEFFLLGGQYNSQIPKNGKHPLDMFETNLELVKDMWANMDTKLGPASPTEVKNGMWEDQNSFDFNLEYDPINFKKYVKSTYSFDAPAITRIGDIILVDEKDVNGFWDWYCKVKPDHKHKKIKVAIGGHNDGSMCLPKPGLVISTNWVDKSLFNETLPGWDNLVIEHPNNFVEQYPQFRELKNKSWFVDGEMGNKTFTNFVDTYLKDWCGNMEESIFEVNMLSVDEKTILSLNYQKDVHNKLKSVNIEPIYTRFRHRNFWDGGLHCLTVDTYREGGCETYL